MKDQDFDANSRRLLLRRLYEGSPDKSVNYSPDWIAATSSSPGRPGPLSVQIADILQRHAKLWAHNMRVDPPASSELGKSAWLLEMREADGEIKRYLANHHLTTGHAA